MKFVYRIALCLGLALVFHGARAAGVLQVTGVTSDRGESFPINTTITFTAEVTNANAVTTYEWDFGDDSPAVKTTVPTVTHIFTAADDSYLVTCTASNGVDPDDADFEFFEAFELPSPDSPQGANANDPPQTNPDTGITFTITQCQGGFLSGTLGISATTAARAVDMFTTSFGDGTPEKHGSTLSHRYKNSGIFVLSTSANRDGSDIGMNRKTLAFSDVEVYGANQNPNVVDLPLDQRKLTFKSIKGKFHFKKPSLERKIYATATDTVTVSWGMTLPAGFDINTQVVELAIGNVKDSIPLKANGTGDLKNLEHVSPFKSVKFKFPRLKKGQTIATNPTESVVTVQMSSADLTGQGFDTEGISPREHQTSKGPFQRSVQVATMFSGMAFTGIAPVTLSVNSDDSFGSISARK